VEVYGNAGVKLQRVTKADAGKYSVEVVTNGSSITTLRRDMHLVVKGQYALQGWPCKWSSYDRTWFSGFDKQEIFILVVMYKQIGSFI
jgi:hypothetical protein